MQKLTLKAIGVALVMLFSILMGWVAYQYNHRPIELHGTLVEPMRDLKPFELMDTQHHAFNLSAVKGHWTILFFGYTQCRSICPTTMAELHKINTLLKKSYHLNIPVQIVMVSLDPQRDTEQSLGQYVKGFDADFLGALGSKSTIDAMTQQLGVVYDTQAALGNNQANDGQIDHSGTLTIMNPEGKVAAFMTPPVVAQDVAEDLATLDKSYKRNQ
jgi:protein SCO1/2